MSHITLFAKVARAAFAALRLLALADPVGARAKPRVPPTAPAPLRRRAAAPDASIIQHIVVLGTQRIEPATVLSYISIREGDIYNEQTSDLALKTLYQTGLFADVKRQIRRHDADGQRRRKSDHQPDRVRR